MQPGAIAKLINKSTNTVRRWTELYAAYLLPAARPQDDESTARVITKQDARVLYYIYLKREQGVSHDEIKARLEEFRAAEWEGLPDLPDHWPSLDGTLAPSYQLGPAMIAQLAAQEKELEYTRRALSDANVRVIDLEEKVSRLESDSRVKDQELQQARIDLEQAKTEVARIEGELAAFTYRGRVISPFILVAAVALMTILITVALLLVGRVL